jgi:hypothetical protein
VYLGELVIQRKNNPKEELDELREFASDIKHYSEPLPSLKSLTALLLGMLTILGTIFGILDVRFSISAILSILFQSWSILIVLLIFLITAIVFLITCSPFLVAFAFKRFLFKGKNFGEENIAFNKANAEKLYNSSIYKLEDQLFQLLGGKEQKPKEIPIDTILQIAFGSFIIVVSQFYMITALDNFRNIEDSNNVISTSNATYTTESLFRFNPYIIFVNVVAWEGITALIGYVYIFISIRQYKKRTEAGLV